MKRRAEAHDRSGGWLRGWLTDEHAASSYGLPLFVSGGRSYGPADLDDRTVRFPEHSDPPMIAAAEAAGYRLAFDY